MAGPIKIDKIVLAPPKSTKKVDWTIEVLRGLGLPDTPANVAFLKAWQRQEGTSAANNPLATTMPAANATNFNSVGVKNYPDAATGIKATIDTLKNYKGILAAFKTGDAAKSASRYVSDFARWSGNTQNLPAATGYVNSILKNVGAPAVFLPSTPGAGEASAAAQDSATQSALVKSQTDPYVTTDGKFVYDSVPTNGIPSQTGEPMRLSEFNAIGKTLNDVYFYYTGKNASPAEIAQYAAGRTSIYELKKKLAERPEFVQSPIYNEKSGDYISVAKDVYGQKFSVPKDLLARAISTGMNQGAFTNELRNLPGYGQSEEFRKQASKYTATARQIFGPRYTPPAKVIKDAVVSGLTPDDFAAQLRGSKDYENSNEFKQMYSGLYGTYAQVYGRPDDQGKLVVKEAAKQGWSAEQFGQYLRSQDAYTQSPEYQSKALGFLDAMGLITGDTPVLRQGMAPQNREAPMAGPNDPAVGPPAPGVKRKPGKSLVAGFAGTRGGEKLYG